MDATKKRLTAMLRIDMVNLARIHKFYLRGFEWAIEPPHEVQKGFEFIDIIETILLKSGYMTEQEIKARHRTFVDEKLKQAAPTKEEFTI